MPAPHEPLRFCPFSAGFGGALDSEAILDFVDAGHDLILAADSGASEEVRNLASDLGVDLEPQGTAVLDTLGGVAQSKSVDAGLVLSSRILAAPAVFGDTPITVNPPPPFLDFDVRLIVLKNASDSAWVSYRTAPDPLCILLRQCRG